MKNIGLIIGVPLIVMAAVIGTAVVLNYRIQTENVAMQPPPMVKKDSITTPTSAASSTSQLQKEIDGTMDDGGATALTDLQKSTESLK